MVSAFRDMHPECGHNSGYTLHVLSGAATHQTCMNSPADSVIYGTGKPECGGAGSGAALTTQGEAQAKIVLIVEDNALDAKLVLHAFAQSDHIVRVAIVNNGVDCLAFLRRERRYADAERPDLIILDLGIPSKNGHEVLAEIKNDPELCQIPVVILSGSSAERDVSLSYKAFANGYVVKPIRPEVFIAKMFALQAFWLSAVELPHRK